ncbi:MAG: SpoIIE family protein phosphatase [Streptosporangiaceae bacterium]|jgi:serine phosphatase RsbU (regulator of sigma subunit)/PAS domain-containing protein
MPDAAERLEAGGDIGGLKSRGSALRQAAALPGTDLRSLLDAALAELDGAIDALSSAEGPGESGDGRAPGAAQSERRLLRAVFQQLPIPLFLLGRDGTIRRANGAASALLGSGPGYATGKPLTSLVDPASRAVVSTQLAAVARTGKPRQLPCSLLAGVGQVSCELAVRLIDVRGDDEQLLVAVSAHRPAANGTAPADGRGRARAVRASKPLPAPGDPVSAAMAEMTRRIDLATAATRLLLENVTFSESVTLQRSARLLASGLASWVIVDLNQRGLLRRHFVTGPDERGSAQLAQAAATVSPEPGSAPSQVNDSGSSLLITHVEDDGILGAGPDGVPLLALFGAASVLSVPLSDGNRTHGVLTLARQASDGHFDLADVGLVEEIAEQVALAISVRRVLRRRTETAEALQASLLPPVLRAVPGVEIALAHMAPTQGREVGGDFYDAYPTPAGWGLSIGDVCGKGEDAAAVTAAARHAIRVLGHWNGDPADVLRGANEIMLAEEFGGRFVTADAAHLSWRGEALRVVLSSAGHPGPVLLHPDGRTRQISGGGLPLGIFPDAEPVTQELGLAAGDVLFFCTDGLTGARSPEQAYFEDSLTEALTSLAGRPPADIVSGMRRYVLDFCAGVLLDDLTMLVLRAGQPPS